MKKKPTTKAVRASAPKPAPVRPLAPPPPPPVVEGDPNLWQTLSSRTAGGAREETSVAEVPGGVLVRSTSSFRGLQNSVALCFVPGVKISGGKIVDFHAA